MTEEKAYSLQERWDTMVADREELYRFFSRASRGRIDISETSVTDRELESISKKMSQIKARDGILRFKRKLLGFFGFTEIVSLEKLTDSLLDLGIATSKSEASEIMNLLDDNYLLYGNLSVLDLNSPSSDPSYSLSFKKVRNNRGDEAYRIRKGFIIRDAGPW